MKNQVVLMKINAAFIGKEQQDQQVISTICGAGHIPLVYGSPEAILSASWRSKLVSKIWTKRIIIAIAIDPFARIYMSVYTYYNYIILFS